jgi:hypothetical protein
MSWFTEEVLCMPCSAHERKIRKTLPANGMEFEGCGYVPRGKEVLVPDRLDVRYSRVNACYVAYFPHNIQASITSGSGKVLASLHTPVDSEPLSLIRDLSIVYSEPTPRAPEVTAEYIQEDNRFYFSFPDESFLLVYENDAEEGIIADLYKGDECLGTFSFMYDDITPTEE